MQSATLKWSKKAPKYHALKYYLRRKNLLTDVILDLLFPMISKGERSQGTTQQQSIKVCEKRIQFSLSLSCRAGGFSI